MTTYFLSTGLELALQLINQPFLLASLSLVFRLGCGVATCVVFNRIVRRMEAC